MSISFERQSLCKAGLVSTLSELECTCLGYCFINQLILVWLSLRFSLYGDDLIEEVYIYRGGTTMVWGEINIGDRRELFFLNRFLDTTLKTILHLFVDAVGQNFHLHDGRF